MLELMIYLKLAEMWHTRRDFVRTTTLAQELSYCERYVRIGLKRLEELGIAERKQQRGGWRPVGV